MTISRKLENKPSKDWIREQIRRQAYFNSEHMVRYLTRGDFTIQDIETVLVQGKIIESHHHPLRRTAFVCLGYPGKKAVHVVFSKDENNHLIVLFAYYPMLPIWKSAIRRLGENADMDQLQKCFFCNSRIEQITVGNFDFRWEGDLYVIKQVPAGLCVQCGEKYISAQASKRIVDRIKKRQIVGEDKVLVFDY